MASQTTFKLELIVKTFVTSGSHGRDSPAGFYSKSSFEKAIQRCMTMKPMIRATHVFSSFC